MRRIGFTLIVLVLCATPVMAQSTPPLAPLAAVAIAPPSAPVMPEAIDPTTVVNPGVVQFVPSADHNTVEPLLGGALVTKYELRVYLQSNPTTTVATQDLGKPTPGTDGTIQVGVDPTAVISKLLKDTLYIAKVAAVGPRGVGESGASNPFGYAGTTPPGAPSVVTIKK